MQLQRSFLRVGACCALSFAPIGHVVAALPNTQALAVDSPE
jgi:hypothetical protein